MGRRQWRRRGKETVEEWERDGGGVGKRRWRRRGKETVVEEWERDGGGGMEERQWVHVGG